MYCLLGDTYKKKNRIPEAIEAYKKAIRAEREKTERHEDVLQYALDSAIALLQGEKDWKAIGDQLRRDRQEAIGNHEPSDR